MLVNGRKLATGLVLVAAVGCGGGTIERPHAEHGGDLTQYEGPIASTDVERGAERFETFCGGCHPGGQEDVGPSLIADPHPPARLRQQIREGSAQMRPFPATRLSDADMETILAYMATIGAVTQPADTTAPGDTTAPADAPLAE